MEPRHADFVHASIGPGGIEIGLRVYPLLPAALASIGPGGIEILVATSTEGYLPPLQSDQVELKFIFRGDDRGILNKLQSDQVELK